MTTHGDIVEMHLIGRLFEVCFVFLIRDINKSHCISNISPTIVLLW